MSDVIDVVPVEVEIPQVEVPQVEISNPENVPVDFEIPKSDVIPVEDAPVDLDLLDDSGVTIQVRFTEVDEETGLSYTDAVYVPAGVDLSDDRVRVHIEEKKRERVLSWKQALEDARKASEEAQAAKLADPDIDIVEADAVLVEAEERVKEARERKMAAVSVKVARADKVLLNDEIDTIQALIDQLTKDLDDAKVRLKAAKDLKAARKVERDKRDVKVK